MGWSRCSMTDEPGRAGTGPDNPGPSGSPSPEPPRLARTLLRCLVPNGELRVVEGELLEGFRSRAAADGRAAAARWYRMQVWGFLARAISVRASTRREPGR